MGYVLSLPVQRTELINVMIKAPGDVHIACGYNCRHRLIPVSDTWAKRKGITIKE